MTPPNASVSAHAVPATRIAPSNEGVALTAPRCNARVKLAARGTNMPRYFFNLRDDTTLMRDDEGQEFASLAEAEAHARSVIDEMTRNLGGAQSGALVVVDAQGNEVTELPLTEGASLPPKGRPPLH